MSEPTDKPPFLPGCIVKDGDRYSLVSEVLLGHAGWGTGSNWGVEYVAWSYKTPNSGDSSYPCSNVTVVQEPRP